MAAVSRSQNAGCSSSQPNAASTPREHLAPVIRTAASLRPPVRFHAAKRNPRTEKNDVAAVEGMVGRAPRDSQRCTAYTYAAIRLRVLGDRASAPKQVPCARKVEART